MHPDERARTIAGATVILVLVPQRLERPPGRSWVTEKCSKSIIVNVLVTLVRRSKEIRRGADGRGAGAAARRPLVESSGCDGSRVGLVGCMIEVGGFQVFFT
jgi:hypothetical protein